MPYISQERRRAIRPTDGRTAEAAETAGELNYLITMLCVEYEDNREYGYQAINDILGALEGAKQEFYRRIAVPYEDMKRKENGDVY